MASNNQTGEYEGQRIGRVDDPKLFHVEENWSRKPTRDMRVPETASDIVRRNIYAVWQTYELSH